MSRKRMIVGGIVALVVIGAALGIRRLANAIRTVQSEAVAFAAQYLGRVSNPWSADAFMLNTTAGFKARHPAEPMALSATLCEQELGCFESLEAERFEVEAIASTRGGSERIVKLYGNADFEKASKRAVRFRLVQQDGIWLVDEFAVDLESVDGPPPDF